jgi:hypothetical protein
MTARNDDIGGSLGEIRARQQEEQRKAAADPAVKIAKLLGVRPSTTCAAA